MTGAFLLLGALFAVTGCASTATAPPPPGASQGHPGARILYAARVEGPDGRRTGLRLAAAVAPPARLRLEVLGPAGGARLVLATEGTRAVALMLAGRRFDVVPATPEALAAWTGLPLGPVALVALLGGHAPCGTGAAAGTDSDGADPCPGVRFRPANVAAGGSACSGTLERLDGGVLATIECSGEEPGGWPERIRVNLPPSRRSLELRRTDGPTPALMQETLFAPEIPAGFERADLFGDAAARPLLGDDTVETP